MEEKDVELLRQSVYQRFELKLKIINYSLELVSFLTTN